MAVGAILQTGISTLFSDFDERGAVGHSALNDANLKKRLFRSVEWLGVGISFDPEVAPLIGKESDFVILVPHEANKRGGLV